MLTSLLAFIFVLGFLVFVHELGHFLVAKWVGVRVQTFSIGFGSRLIGFKRGDTDYRISAIPLGGYVKMAGENPTEETTGAPDEFNAKSVPQRMAIILAGPIMNLLWAVIFLSLIFYIGIEREQIFNDPPAIGWVEPRSAAEQAGVQPGDRITEIAGRQVSTWQDVRIAVAPISRGEVPVTFQRDGEQRSVQFMLADSLQVGWFLGCYPQTPPVIERVVEGGAAAAAGFQDGDRIVAIEGEPVDNWYKVVHQIRASANQTLNVEVARGNERLALQVTPTPDEKSGIGLIGIYVQRDTYTVKYGVVESLQRGVQQNVELASLLFSYIGRIFVGKESGDQIGSVITIAQVSGQAARAGWDALLQFMGFLSLQLGLLNLLPIPILDGGHMVILTIEGISGKPVSLRMRGIAQAIGLFILISIMAFAFFNDITRIFS